MQYFQIFCELQHKIHRATPHHVQSCSMLCTGLGIKLAHITMQDKLASSSPLVKSSYKSDVYIQLVCSLIYLLGQFLAQSEFRDGRDIFLERRVKNGGNKVHQELTYYKSSLTIPQTVLF